MAKVLVACADYPYENNVSMEYVHVRNIEYKKNNIVLDVLNFNAKNDYTIDGIRVITLKNIERKIEEYRDYVLVCHAPNIRNHYFFLKKYEKVFKKVIFVLHGHEIVEKSKVYPPAYSFKKENFIKNLFTRFYDKVKIAIWKRYLKKRDIKLIFVSKFLRDEFKKNFKVSQDFINKKTVVIHNSVSYEFEINKYDSEAKKLYDFITIRSNLDSSVYCVDLIVDIAENNIDRKFLIIGKGSYFEHRKLPDNISLINDTFSHGDLLGYINQARYALMPTRRDSQGVMSCELATFRIPLITSDLEVCKEMFSDFKNVALLNNEDIAQEVKEIEKLSLKSGNQNKKFYKENTIYKEIELLNRLYFSN